jgi:nicotinamide mononucleotide transporter
MLATVLEYSAVVLNIGFSILIAWEKRLGWLLGFVAAVITVLLYAVEDAWLMAALNVFYAGMGLYGWWTWGNAVKERRITTFPWRRQAVFMGLCAAGTLGLVWLMDAARIPGRYQGMEAFITASAMVATWLMSRKAVENWLYWIVGDITAVLYNHLIGYEGYALLNVVYIVLAVIGFIRWRRQFLAARVG